MRYLLFLWIAVTLSTNSFAQTSHKICGTNVIRNHDFEAGKGPQDSRSLKEGAAFSQNNAIIGQLPTLVANPHFKWRSRSRKCDDGKWGFHSPDWYSDAYTSYGVAAQSGNKYMGFFPYEMFLEKLDNALDQNQEYRLSFWVWLESNGIAECCDYSDVQIAFHTAKTPLKYEKNWPKRGESCEKLDHDYINLKSSDIRNSYYVPLNNIPLGEWHNIVIYFTTPSENYDWVGFEMVHWLNGSRLEKEQAYALIDKVELTKSCDEPCGPLAGCIQLDVENTIDYNRLFSIDGLQNVTDFKFTVWDGAGRTIYVSNNLNCSLGFNGTFQWNGINSAGDPVANGNYHYRITASNNCVSGEASGTVKVVGPSTSTIGLLTCNSTLSNAPAPCCDAQEDLYIDNQTLNNPTPDDFVTINRIVASQTGAVTLANSADVLFQAGNQVAMFPGFHVQNGANFRARIEACASADDIPTLVIDFSFLFNGKRSASNDGMNYEVEVVNYEEQMEKSSKVNRFRVYPNPTVDRVKISLDEGEYSDIQLTDINGKILESMKVDEEDHTVEFDLSNLAQGAYFVILKVNGKRYTEKIIKR